ncbi:two-component system sensor histidine kinase YesM [Lachnospiraceae bacterium PM6-15]
MHYNHDIKQKGNFDVMLAKLSRTRKKSIRIQLILGFLVVLIPLVLLLEVGLYLYSSRIIEEKTVGQAKETVEQFVNSLDYFMEQNINKIEMIACNPTIQMTLNPAEDANYQSENPFYTQDQQIQRIMLKEYSSVTMNDIELYGINGTNYYYSIWSEKPEIPDEERLLLTADEAKGKWVLISEDEQSDSVHLLKQVKDLQTYKVLGYIRVGLKRSYIEKMASGINFDSGGTMSILYKGELLASGGLVDEKLIQKMQGENGADGRFRYRLDSGTECEVFYVHSSVVGWNCMGVIPLTYIQKELAGLRYASVLLLLVALIGGIILISKIAKSLTSPISETADALAQFSTGDFDVRLSVDREDEIGKMNEVFNTAIEDIQVLMQKVTQAEILKREMEYKTLQSQMNPHFLYNTLDAINWMAFKKGEREICDLVSAISDLLRESINNKQSLITLGQELDYVKNYLHIQQVRFHDYFTIYYDIDESLLDQLIPKLVVQPIVENAIIHGLDNGQSGTSLLISVKEYEKTIHIMVRDDGVGISQERIEELFSEKENETAKQKRFHTNLGIYAVSKRIQFLYGEEYGVEIESKEGAGTTVTLKIPHLEDQQHLYTICNFFSEGEEDECKDTDN